MGTTREASALCAILDDAAAVGDHDKLRKLAGRWGTRAMVLRMNPRKQHRAMLWQMAAAAAEYRAFAVNHRLRGRMTNAIENETSSETMLRMMAQHATR